MKFHANNIRLSAQSHLLALVSIISVPALQGVANAADAKSANSKQQVAASSQSGKPTVEAASETPPSPGSEAPGATGSETIITATEHLLLDSKGYEATFTGDVKVFDPRFALSCRKLVAYMKRPPSEAKPAPKPQAGKKAGQAEETPSAGGIEKAVAEGDVVIVQDKVNEKGEVDRSVGRGAKALYDGGSGNITLSGWPQVEQKVNAVVATDESTVIVLDSKGKMEVIGHSKTVLRNTNVDDRR